MWVKYDFFQLANMVEADFLYKLRNFIYFSSSKICNFLILYKFSWAKEKYADI